MLIDLSDVFSSRENHIHAEAEYEEDSFGRGKRKVKLLESSKLVLDVYFVEKNRAKVKGSINLIFDTVCDRCLKSIPLELKLSFEELVVSLEAESADEEERQYMEGFKLDTERLLKNEISLRWPSKILCREDCRGLCLKCGRDLNEGECGCDRFVPDPRMAHIKDVFDAYHKETKED